MRARFQGQRVPCWYTKWFAVWATFKEPQLTRYPGQESFYQKRCYLDTVSRKRPDFSIFACPTLRVLPAWFGSARIKMDCNVNRASAAGPHPNFYLQVVSVPLRLRDVTEGGGATNGGLSR